MLHNPPYQAFARLRLACTILLMAAAAAAFSKPSPAAVFGTDDRVPLPESDQVIKEKIGTLVSSDTGAYCTAFCVAPGLIATASHCLFGTAAKPAPKLKSLSFKTAAGVSATAIAGRTNAGQLQNVISGTAHLSVEPPIGAAYDWAVARLETPVCMSSGLHLSSKTPAEIQDAAARGAIYQIAVHADMPDTNLRRGGPCALPVSFTSAGAETIARDFASPAAILFHTCDTGGGSSGSPLIVDTPAGPEVIGINVGTYVLSRTVTTAQDKGAKQVSEPIANTAIRISEIARAIAALNRR